jgi:hypothetical protein
VLALLKLDVQASPEHAAQFGVTVESAQNIVVRLLEPAMLLIKEATLMIIKVLSSVDLAPVHCPVQQAYAAHNTVTAE